MDDPTLPFENGDHVVMVASWPDDGDPPDGTTGVVCDTSYQHVTRVRWHNWSNSSVSEWFVRNDQITRVVSPP